MYCILGEAPLFCAVPVNGGQSSNGLVSRVWRSTIEPPCATTYPKQWNFPIEITFVGASLSDRDQLDDDF